MTIVKVRGALSIFQRGALTKNLDLALKNGSRKFWWGDEVLNSVEC